MSVSQHPHHAGSADHLPDGIPHEPANRHVAKPSHEQYAQRTNNAEHHPLHKPHAESVLKPAGEPETPAKKDDRSQAVNLVRQKLATIYGVEQGQSPRQEPNVKQELTEAKHYKQHSVHQEYLLQLQRSGMSAAEVQTNWHTYYQSLNDAGKREVWQEFYSHSASEQAHDGQPASAHRGHRGQPEDSTTGSQHTPKHQQPHTPARHNAHAIYPTPTSELVITPTNITTGEAAVAGGPHQSEVNSANNPDPLEAVVPSQPAEHQDEPRFEHQPTAFPPTTPTDTPHPAADFIIKNPLTEHLITYEDIREPSAVRASIKDTVGKRRTSQAKSHLKSLAFGLAFGGVTLLVVMFSFFNEVIIAPFLQPSRNVSATPIIVTPGSTIASDKDEIIIPKINVQIPLVFDVKTSAKAEFEAALDRGVSHYPTTALPGEKGNASFFGHSSNNIFNPGKYKFAFVLLNELVPGDTFYINYKGVSYAYQVYDKKIVDPSEVDILNPVANKTATAMLVTCDPPGTTLHRLVIWGEQVTPNPNSNTAQSTPASGQQATEALPGNGKSLWSRMWGWVTGN